MGASIKLLLLGREGKDGLGGIFGTKSLGTTGGSLRTSGADLTVTRGIFCAFAISSRSRLVGGSGGSLACSKGGGNFLPSTDEALVVDDPV